MANPLPPGSHRALSGVDPLDDNSTAVSLQAVIEALRSDAVSSSSVRPAVPVAFVVFVAIELAFVFGLLVCTKLSPVHVMQITAEATAISVAGFFGRNAAIILGRRMIAGLEKQ
jgi:hypothetical protein